MTLVKQTEKAQDSQQTLASWQNPIMRTKRLLSLAKRLQIKISQFILQQLA